MEVRRSLFIGAMSLVTISALLLGFAAPAAAATAKPFAFTGKADDPNVCGDPYPAGAEIVTAAWLAGIGLPDNGGSSENPGDPSDLPNKKDARFGLLLSKNGPTSVCSSSGVTITGLPVSATTVTAGHLVGFDYRNGSHCGAGAPRFNISWNDGSDGFSFTSCSAGTATVSTQDSAWTQVRVDLQNPSQTFPIVPVGAIITGISIVFDEGTDAQPIGLAILDNITINTTVIKKGSGSAH